MSLDADIISVYTDELIALSQKAETIPPVANPDISAKAISPVCGSEVTVFIALDGGKIKHISFTVEACALTRVVLAVMHEAARGKTRADIARAGAAMKSMLEGGAVKPSGDWAKLLSLESVREYPARHNAILLPFEAVEKAFAGRGR